MFGCLKSLRAGLPGRSRLRRWVDAGKSVGESFLETNSVLAETCDIMLKEVAARPLLNDCPNTSGTLAHGTYKPDSSRSSRIGSSIWRSDTSCSTIPGIVILPPLAEPVLTDTSYFDSTSLIPLTYSKSSENSSAVGGVLSFLTSLFSSLSSLTSVSRNAL